MPFQSEEQRKYLWANEPAIAKRWEKYPKGYNTGGVSHLFRSKEDRVGFNAGSWKGNPGTDSRKEVRDAWKAFLEYRKNRGTKSWQKYMPIWIGANLAHGGYVRPEDSGVLGLADGGQLVKPGPGRPGYNGWESDFSSDWGGEAEPQGSPPGTDPGPGQQETTVTDYEYEAYNPPETVTPTTDDKGDGDAREKYISEQYTSPEALDAKRRRELRDLVNRQEEKTEAWEKTQDWEKDSKLVTALKWIGGAAAVIGTGGAALGFGELGIVKFANTVNSVNKLSNTFVKGYNLFNKTNYTKTELWNKIQEEAKLAKELEKKSAGLGGEEFQRLTYADQLKLLQFRDKDEKDEDITTTTIEEDVSKYATQEEMMAASQRAYEMLYGDRRRAEVIPEDTSKRDAYLAAYRQKYLMGAKGGRVPGGYNTGGLSNLFRLKNR